MKALVCLLLAVAYAPLGFSQEHPFAIAGKAKQAYADGRYADAAELLGQVTQRIPGWPDARIDAARALIRAGKTAEALAQLSAAVDLGVRFDSTDEAWNAVRGEARFKSLESRMKGRTAPVVRSSVAFRMDRRLTPENVAYDPKSGTFFVGSMYYAKIVRIDRNGVVTDFVSPRRDGLLSVLGMKVDAKRRELWAAAGNFGERPPMEVDDPASAGKGMLFRFRVESGELVRMYPAPEGTQFNDLVITPGGDVYTTAGLSGIWRVRAGSEAVEPFLQPRGSFFNGIAITPDGKTIFAASHLEGVMKIDVATKEAVMLELPPGGTLFGIDGLYLHGRSLIAIQNGTDPQRVIRAKLDRQMERVTRIDVLEQEHPEADHPLTGAIVGRDLYYVGRSQIRAFEGKKIWPDEKLKETTILRLPIGR